MLKVLDHNRRILNSKFRGVSFVLMLVCMVLIPVFHNYGTSDERVIAIGAVCEDGTRSRSVGPGTCSWHGGVDHYIYKQHTTEASERGRVTAIIVISACIGWLIFFGFRDSGALSFLWLYVVVYFTVWFLIPVLIIAGSIAVLTLLFFLIKGYVSDKLKR